MSAEASCFCLITFTASIVQRTKCIPSQIVVEGGKHNRHPILDLLDGNHHQRNPERVNRA